MADFGEALKARLIADADIGSEVHWVKVPQGKSLPYTRLQIISDPRPENLGGYDGARVTRVQADFFSSKWGEARAMAERSIAILATPATVAGVHFGHIKAVGPRDLGEDVPGSEPKFIHRASLDLLVEHRLV